MGEDFIKMHIDCKKNPENKDLFVTGKSAIGSVEKKTKKCIITVT
jgi:hypothetical protein